MSRRLMDDELDTTLQRYLAWRAERIAGAPDAGTVAATLERRLDGGRVEHGRSVVLARGAWLTLAVAILMLAIIGAAVVGSRRPVTERLDPVTGSLTIGGADTPCCRYGLAIAGDGRILVGHLDDGQLRLMTFDSSGQMDTSSGADEPLLSGDWLRGSISVARQPDGQFVVVRAAGGDIELARYRADGTGDASFGAHGSLSVRLVGVFRSPGPDEAVQGQVVVTPDHRLLVVGGSVQTAQSDSFELARFLPDGSPDPAFGRDGRVSVDIAFGSDTAFAATVAPDGRITVVGQTGYLTPGPWDNNIAVLRLLPDGAVDESFGRNGVVTTHVPGSVNSSAGAVALGSDGRIIVTGRGSSPFAVLRYLPDGTADPAWSANGMTSLPGAPRPFACAVQEDGRVVLVASGRLVRLGVNGELDATFGPGGSVVLP